MPFYDVRSVKAAATGRWDQILAALSPALQPALEKPGRHFSCPVHGGKDGDAFRVFRDVADSGGGVCNTCGAFSDGFKLLAWAHGQSFAEVLAAVATYLGFSSNPADAPKLVTRPPPPLPKATAKAEDPGIRDRLRSVYRGSIPLQHKDAEPARLYIRNRGLELIPPMLRMHPSLYYRDPDGNRFGPYPTLISLVTDPQLRGVTLHRIYLTPDGRKAPVAKPKKLMSHPSEMSMTGAAIRLFPHGPVLAVSEGIETAIAVTQATGIPCWPTITSSLMPGFTPPSDVERVIVFADKDLPTKLYPTGAGQETGKKLVLRLWEIGFKASLAIPPSAIPDDAKSVDWLDEFVRFGAEPFRAALAA